MQSAFRERAIPTFDNGFEWLPSSELANQFLAKNKHRRAVLPRFSARHCNSLRSAFLLAEYKPPHCLLVGRNVAKSPTHHAPDRHQYLCFQSVQADENQDDCHFVPTGNFCIDGKAHCCFYSGKATNGQNGESIPHCPNPLRF